MAVIAVDRLDDPRLDDYRDLKDRPLNARGNRFVAESELVVRRLVESDLQVLSVLLTGARLESLRPLLADVPYPVYLADQALLDGVAGFHVHRGCLAIGVRPATVRLRDPVRLLIVLEDLVDVDNLGATVRNATALGASGLVLSPRCADPYYRKAIRTAIGATFNLPILRLASWPSDLIALRDRHHLRLVGAVVDPAAVPLRAYRPRLPAALLLGAEGPGLSAGARASCDDLVTIPVAPGADSLNVATAGAIIAHHLLA